MTENTQETLSSSLQPALEILRRNPDFRVWSVIVTLFGDLAQKRDDRISGALMSRLCARMGIRPEAMRVALHRLRKDGWIVSERTGRTSVYRLSDTGFAESLAARGRIYAAKVEMPGCWSLCVAAPGPLSERLKQDRDMVAMGALVVAPGVYLTAKAPEREGFLSVSGNLNHLPDWLSAMTAPHGLTREYRGLSELLVQLNGVLDTALQTDNLDIAVLRVLIIHNWRRLVLRHAPLSAEFYPDGWAGLVCRQQVNALLTRLARPKLAILQD